MKKQQPKSPGRFPAIDLSDPFIQKLEEDEEFREKLRQAVDEEDRKAKTLGHAGMK